jgi:hypothetical protein
MTSAEGHDIESIGAFDLFDGALAGATATGLGVLQIADGGDSGHRGDHGDLSRLSRRP